MMEMHEIMSSIKQIPAEKWTDDFAIAKIFKFKSSLNEVLDLSPLDVEDSLKRSKNLNAIIDYQFLLAQREIPQRGDIDRLDKKTFGCEAKKQKRSASSLSATHLQVIQLIQAKVN